MQVLILSFKKVVSVRALAVVSNNALCFHIFIFCALLIRGVEGNDIQSSSIPPF